MDEIYYQTPTKSETMSLSDINEWIAYTFGIDKNTSATILITLFVFISGALLAQFLVYLKASSIKRMRRRITLLNLDVFAKEVGSQCRAYYQVAAQLKKSAPEGPLIFTRSHISQIQILKELGYEQMFDAFFSRFPWIILNRKMKLKAFNKLWQTMQVIDYWQLRSENSFSDFLHQYNAFNDKRNQAISAYLRFIEPTLVQAEGKEIGKEVSEGLAEYLTKIASIHEDWRKQNKRRRPQVMQKKLIQPLVNLNKDYKNTVAAQINDHLLHASVHYENLSRLEKNSEKQFFFYYILFKAKKKILVKIKVIFADSFFTLFRNITNHFSKGRRKKTT